MAAGVGEREKPQVSKYSGLRVRSAYPIPARSAPHGQPSSFAVSGLQPQPLTTIMGRRRATFLPIPAPSVVSTTSVTSL